MRISIGIVAYNEEKHLPYILADIEKQTYPLDKIELILADSMSEDNTMRIMMDFAKKNGEKFSHIKVIHNRGRIQSCGWNRIIDTFTTEVLIRIDAHSRIPEDFVEKNVEALQTGESVTGGIRPNVAESDSAWQQILLTAESSMFGSSVAGFRREEKKAYVKSLFHAAYRREVFEVAGGFREDLGRTEDNEFHYRIRQHGFRICMVPGIHSYQMIRPSLRKMCQQKYGNGYWIGLTSGVCPGCLSLYHFVPFAFVCAIVLTTCLALQGTVLPGLLLWGMYTGCALIMTVAAMVADLRKGTWNAGELLLPVLFFLLHISYGAGTLAGLLRMPFWRRKHQGKEWK